MSIESALVVVAARRATFARLRLAVSNLHQLGEPDFQLELLAGPSLVIVLLIVLVLATLGSMQRSRAAARATETSWSHLVRTQDARRLMADTSSSNAAFFATGDERFAKRSWAGIANLRALLGELRAEVEDEESHNLHARAVERAEAWISEYVGPTFELRRRVTQGEVSPELLRRTISADSSSAYRRDVDAMLDSVEGFERETLAARREAEAQADQRLVLVLIGGAALAILLGLLVSRHFARRIAARVERLREAAARVGGGDFAQRLQVDSRDAIGRLSVAFNQMPLTYVIANLGQLHAELRKPTNSVAPQRVEEFKEMIFEASEGAERVKRIVRDLKTFSRVDPERRVPVNVRAVLEASINLAASDLRQRGRLVAQLTPCEHVLANDAQLGQVFINLLINAAQAIPAGNPDQHQIRVTCADRPDGRVAIEVSDTGAGIPPEIIGKVFDPFFTTKPVGEGTGLGLSICRSLVTGFGGEIQVRSRVGKGTTFRVLLPGVARSHAVQGKVSLLNGSERVL
jgi:signal transduction histidine kinase